MTKNEFILEYALRHRTYPETSLLEQLTPCFMEPVVEEPQKITCTSEDYKEKAKDYKYVKLLVDCTAGQGRHTFPKGFVFEIRKGAYENIHLRCNCTLEDSSATPCYYNLTRKMVVDVITKSELLNEGTVSTITRKVKSYQPVRTYVAGQIIHKSRPVYSNNFDYKI